MDLRFDPLFLLRVYLIKTVIALSQGFARNLDFPRAGLWLHGTLSLFLCAAALSSMGRLCTVPLWGHWRTTLLGGVVASAATSLSVAMGVSPALAQLTLLVMWAVMFGAMLLYSLRKHHCAPSPGA